MKSYHIPMFVSVHDKSVRFHLIQCLRGYGQISRSFIVTINNKLLKTHTAIILVKSKSKCSFYNCLGNCHCNFDYSHYNCIRSFRNNFIKDIFTNRVSNFISKETRRNKNNKKQLHISISRLNETYNLFIYYNK